MNQDLNEVRKRIDSIDHEIMELLNQRMELSVRSRKLKKKTADPDREKEVLSNVARMSRLLVTAEFSQRLFREIIDESKRVQDKWFKDHRL